MRCGYCAFSFDVGCRQISHFFERACIAVVIVGSLALVVEAPACLIRFAVDRTLTFAMLALGVGRGFKISASVMYALSRLRGEAMGVRFRFLSDVGRLSCAPDTGVANRQVCGVRICDWATGRATTGLLLDGKLRGVITRAGRAWSLVLLLDKSGQSGGVLSWTLLVPGGG